MTDLSAQARRRPERRGFRACHNAHPLLQRHSDRPRDRLQSVPAETIGSLCTRAHSLRDSVVLHARLLPWTNISMFASGVAAACYSAWPHCDLAMKWRARYAPILPYIGCSVVMLAGMPNGSPRNSPAILAWHEPFRHDRGDVHGDGLRHGVLACDSLHRKRAPW
jgi:hypothetical protein